MTSIISSSWSDIRARACLFGEASDADEDGGVSEHSLAGLPRGVRERFGGGVGGVNDPSDKIGEETS